MTPEPSAGRVLGCRRQTCRPAAGGRAACGEPARHPAGKTQNPPSAQGFERTGFPFLLLLPWASIRLARRAVIPPLPRLWLLSSAPPFSYLPHARRGSCPQQLGPSSSSPLAGSFIILSISLLHHSLTRSRHRAGGFALCTTSTAGMQEASLTARAACSVWGPPPLFGVPSTTWACPARGAPCSHTAPRGEPASRGPGVRRLGFGKPLPSLIAVLGPFSATLCPNRSPRAGTERSEASTAEKQRGETARPGCAGSCVRGSRRRKGGSLIVLSEGKRDSPLNGSARKDGNTSRLWAAGCICPRRAEDTCPQHKPPPRRRSTICDVLQGFDAFHVQLQEREDPPAAALQRNTQMLRGRRTKQLPHRAPGNGGTGCPSRCPARRDPAHRRRACPQTARTDGERGKTMPRREATNGKR